MKSSELRRKTYWTASFLAAFVLLLAGSVLFLNPSSVGNPRFVWNINLWAVVWALSFLIILVLTFILARNLIKLLFEFQENRLGSRIKTKLVITLIVFSLFPALIMAFLAFGLINRNLRQWFSSPSEQLLHSAQLIASNYYEEKRTSILNSMEFLAAQVDVSTLSVAPRIHQFSEQGLDSLILVDRRLRGIARWGSLQESVLLKVGPRVLRGERFYELDRDPERPDQELGVAGVPVRAADGSVVAALIGTFSIPQSISFYAIRAQEAFNRYEQIKGGASQLEINYFSILALTTLAVVFGFVWLGTYISKKITIPIEALAQGSRELAEGNLDYRVDVSATDELEILVQSFNRMARELRESRAKLEITNDELRSSNVRLEERRRYIEAVLQNIATGVITIDENDVVRTLNEAAVKMLQLNREQSMNRQLKALVEPELHQDIQAMKTRARLYGSYRKELTFHREDQLFHVAATITVNPGAPKGEEYLIVLDDLTELIKAQKFAAWQEVARRLAHEIKNPLTPIQLSAERLKKRFDRIVSESIPDFQVNEFGRILNEAVLIIAAEAETLKTLVDEFSRFARMPMFNPVPVSLHDLLEQSIALYDGGLEGINIEKRFDTQLEEVRIDPEQMKRVFVNLIDNSLDALAEVKGKKQITITTRLNPSRDTYTVEFFDNGIGISPDDYENLFLPYFSTKRKGTGLGLAIVRQIISEHSGFIRAEANFPQGARFIMELPLSVQ